MTVFKTLFFSLFLASMAQAVTLVNSNQLYAVQTNLQTQIDQKPSYQTVTGIVTEAIITIPVTPELDPVWTQDKAGYVTTAGLATAQADMLTHGVRITQQSPSGLYNAPLVVQNLSQYGSGTPPDKYNQFAQVWLNPNGDRLARMRVDGAFIMEGRIDGAFYNAIGGYGYSFITYIQPYQQASVLQCQGWELRYPAVGTFALDTLGTNRVLIDGTGHVGIGTTPSPSWALNVAGGIGSDSIRPGTGILTSERIYNQYGWALSYYGRGVEAGLGVLDALYWTGDGDVVIPNGNLSVLGDANVSSNLTVSSLTFGTGTYARTITHPNGNDIVFNDVHVCAGYGMGLYGERGSVLGMTSGNTVGQNLELNAPNKILANGKEVLTETYQPRNLFSLDSTHFIGIDSATNLVMYEIAQVLTNDLTRLIFDFDYIATANFELPQPWADPTTFTDITYVQNGNWLIRGTGDDDLYSVTMEHDAGELVSVWSGGGTPPFDLNPGTQGEGGTVHVTHPQIMQVFTNAIKTFATQP